MANESEGLRLAKIAWRLGTHVTIDWRGYMGWVFVVHGLGTYTVEPKDVSHLWCMAHDGHRLDRNITVTTVAETQALSVMLLYPSDTESM